MGLKAFKSLGFRLRVLGTGLGIERVKQARSRTTAVPGRFGGGGHGVLEVSGLHMDPEANAPIVSRTKSRSLGFRV